MFFKEYVRKYIKNSDRFIDFLENKNHSETDSKLNRFHAVTDKYIAVSGVINFVLPAIRDEKTQEKSKLYYIEELHNYLAAEESELVASAKKLYEYHKEFNIKNDGDTITGIFPVYDMFFPLFKVDGGNLSSEEKYRLLGEITKFYYAILESFTVISDKLTSEEYKTLTSYYEHIFARVNYIEIECLQEYAGDNNYTSPRLFIEKMETPLDLFKELEEGYYPSTAKAYLASSCYEGFKRSENDDTKANFAEMLILLAKDYPYFAKKIEKEHYEFLKEKAHIGEFDHHEIVYFGYIKEKMNEFKAVAEEKKNVPSALNMLRAIAAFIICVLPVAFVWISAEENIAWFYKNAALKYYVCIVVTMVAALVMDGTVMATLGLAASVAVSACGSLISFIIGSPNVFTYNIIMTAMMLVGIFVSFIYITSNTPSERRNLVYKRISSINEIRERIYPFEHFTYKLTGIMEDLDLLDSIVYYTSAQTVLMKIKNQFNEEEKKYKK